MYYVYAAFAFAEVFVLFASFLGILALTVRGILRACCKLKNEIKKSHAQCAFSRASRVDPCWLQCRHRLVPQRS
jgi:hypothetical protein